MAFKFMTLLLLSAKCDSSYEDDLSTNDFVRNRLLNNLSDDLRNSLRKIIEILERPNPYKHQLVL